MSQNTSVVDLITAVDSKLKKVNTQSLDLSFNEILDMKINGEINITPDFQRLFQWSEGARSRFIESLLLEMPVPPIYVIEEDDSSYILIDGLQRISSYLHLRGYLEAPHLETPVALGEKLRLTDCDIVEELNGKTFDDLGTALQIRLKRAFVRVEVIRKGSDPRFKYHMFKRLNQGGQLLTDQQIRNCTIRLLSASFNDFIINLSKDESFQLCTDGLTTERRLGAFDQELILRFFAFKNNRIAFKHDVADFLTGYMEGVSDPENIIPFNYNVEREIFLKTFLVFERALGEHSFAFVNSRTLNIGRGFSVYHYEAFTLGIQPHLGKIDPDDNNIIEILRRTFMDIKQDREFIKITTGGGKNSPGPLKERIEFVQQRLESVL